MSNERLNSHILGKAFLANKCIKRLRDSKVVLLLKGSSRYSNHCTHNLAGTIRAIRLLSYSAIVFAMPVKAQMVDTANNGEQVYSKIYFAQFAPQTARDMIDRLPGFTIDLGSDLRGFGGGAGNVLINDARPSSKAGGIEDALTRISARSVDRIEVIRGSGGSSEAAGQSIIANIITNKSNQTSHMEFELGHAEHGKINTAGELSLTRTISAWDTSTKFSGFIERRPLEGTRISRDASGIDTFLELEDVPSDNRRLALSTQAKRPVAGGVLTLNGRLSHRPYIFGSSRTGYEGGSQAKTPDQFKLIDFSRTRNDGEIGIDWKRPLSNDWSLKLLSVSSLKEHQSQSLVFTQRPVGVNDSNSSFDTEQNIFETIFRATLGRSSNLRLEPEFGFEITYNRLDSNFGLRVEDQSGARSINLPAANVLVEEVRGEAFANLIWKASQRITVETGFGTELSEISVSGDADNKESFFFAKPFAALIYDPRPGMQFRLGARRTVGQLDFSDFAASASASDDRLLGGNPELGPDQTTRLSSSIDLRSETLGAINIELFHEWRDDILEQIVLSSGAQGLGNAGSARVWGLKTTASLPLSKIIAGGLLEVQAEFLDSTFFDPIISGQRSVSSIDSTNLLIEFRQDIAEWKMAWGGSYRAPLKGPFFFADEISVNRDGAKWRAFIETSAIRGMKLNLTFTGIGSLNFSRERRFFSPDRGGVFEGSQVIDRDTGMSATLNISGQF